MAKHSLLGAWGEELAAAYLRRKKGRILATNFHSRFGEIDLIAKSGKYLLFVEVKLRRDSHYAEAREYVDRRKQERLRATAAVYLQQNPTHLQPRFDVIEVYAPHGLQTAEPVIYHWEDAFQ